MAGLKLSPLTIARDASAEPKSDFGGANGNFSRHRFQKVVMELEINFFDPNRVLLG